MNPEHGAIDCGFTSVKKGLFTKGFIKDENRIKPILSWSTVVVVMAILVHRYMVGFDHNHQWRLN